MSHSPAPQVTEDMDNESIRKNMRDDEQVLEATLQMQRETKQALSRMNQQAKETHDIAACALNEMYNQRHTIVRATEETDRLQANLDKTDKLQDRMSRWKFTFGSRRLARRAAAQDAERENEREQFRQKHMPRGIQHEEVRNRLDKARNIAPDHQDVVMHQSHGNALALKQDTLSGSDSGDCDRDIDAEQDTSEMNDLDASIRLDILQSQDNEVDDALDCLAAQIEGLCDIAKAQQSEIQLQNPMIDNLTQEVREAKERQKAVNYRNCGFLAGRWRQKDA